MGTVKYSGPIASFHCPTNADIRSLKVHFSPKQLGEGTPSPENVRPIEGWDGVTVHNDDGVIVPEEYKKIEYLESSGTQWIDTGVMPDANTIVTFKCMNLEKTGDVIIGYFVKSDIGNDHTDWRLFNYNNVIYYDVPDSISGSSYGRRTITSKKWNPNEIVELEVGNLYIKDLSTGTIVHQGSPYSDIPSVASITLNCYGDDTLGRRCSKNRWYYVKIYDGSTLLRDLIPCVRIIDNNPGMYDTVSGEFFTNQGTGEFICGPDVGITIDYEFGVLGKNKFPLRTTNQFLNTSTGWSNTNTRDMTTGDVFVNISSNNYWNGRTDAVYGISIGDGSVSYHAINSSYGMGIFVPVSPDTEYTLSHAETAAMTRIGYYDSVGNHLNVNLSFTGTSKTFTTTVDTFYILVDFATDSTGTEGDYTVSNIQLELGSTATTYEPYNPNKTVYGGWVDLITGEVVQTHHKITLTSNERIYSITDVSTDTISPITQVQFHNKMGNVIYNQNFLDATLMAEQRSKEIKNKYTHGEYLLDTSPTYHGLVVSNKSKTASFAIVFLPCDSTEQSVKDYLTTEYNNGTPVEFVYELAEPITYNLAPTQLQTFLGQNNIWFNADYVEVEYDLHETQNILARKQFIVANQPHIESVSGNIANFNTDMIAPLKDAKIYFNPIQEGEGDPSPDNVRAISGWNGISLYHTNKELYKCESGTINGTAEEIASSNSMRSIGNMIITPGQTYTFNLISNNSNANLFRIFTYNLSNQLLEYSNRYDSTSITTYIGTAYGTQKLKLRLTIKTSDQSDFTLTDILNTIIEVSNTSFAYSSSIPISIDWSSTTGTIYGGYVDLIKGELVQTYKDVTLDGTFDPWKLQWSTVTDKNTGETLVNTLYYKKDTGDNRHSRLAQLYADTMPVGSNYNINTPRISAYDGDSFSICLTLPETISYSLESLNAYLTENPIHVVFELQNPIVYQLTPQQLKTLKGINNIWSDTNGPISIKYWTH